MINATNAISDTLNNVDWANVIMGIPGINGLIKIGAAVGIAVLVYIAFLIIRSIVSINYSFRFKRMTVNVEEINKKMDRLIEALSGKKKK